MDCFKSPSVVPEDITKLVVLDCAHGGTKLNHVLESLRQDKVVLIRPVTAEQADCIVYEVAYSLGLADALKLQSGLASVRGHRHNIGKYFMSTNARGDYQFIPPHSEGSSFINTQLACFFCSENSTDGGETLLFKVNSAGEAWRFLRERVNRAKLPSRRFLAPEIVRARLRYQLHLPADVLKEDDQMLTERQTEIPGLSVIEVLAKPVLTYSRILQRPLHVYWDSIGSIDFDSAVEYASVLSHCGLLKEPSGGLALKTLDNAARRRLWSSGVRYSQVFDCKITLKLTPGDLIIQNNLTWAHSANNWSPGSGVRTIAASFA